MDSMTMFYPPFACNEDNGCLGIKWKKWKRGFEIFLSAKGITGDIRKKNLLLHCAGPDVQDIFFTLPESEDTENEQQYDLTMQALDGYFSPKSNTVYERYIFRSLKQQPGESIDQFIIKLLLQGKNCNYTDLNDQIRDQVIDKCLSSELRRKMLEKGDIKLEELREIAKAFEATKLQMKNVMKGTYFTGMYSTGMTSEGAAGGAKKGGSGYTKQMTLSPELAALVGQDSMARHEVVKKVWAIIKEKDLYDPKNKQFAICDDALMKVIGVKRFRTFGMMKYLKTHFIS